MSFDSPAPESGTRGRAALQWLLLGGVCLVALAVAAAHAPPQVRRIVLFPLAWGAAAGAVLGWAGRATGLAGAGQGAGHGAESGGDDSAGASPRHAAPCRPAGGICLAAFVLIAAGQVLLAVESHRLWAAPQRAEIRESPLRQLRESLKQEDAGGDEEARRHFEQMVERAVEDLEAAVRFTTWLQRRVEPLRWPVWAAVLLWSGELLTGSALGAWVAARGFRHGGE